MLTRRQLAMAPIIKTAAERQAEAFGKDVMIAMERALRGIDFTDCAKQRDGMKLLLARVRKIMRARGAPWSRYAYIARRMCKTMISEIVKAGLKDIVTIKKEEDDGDAPGGASDDTVR